jgi:hypothetical protein
MKDAKGYLSKINSLTATKDAKDYLSNINVNVKSFTAKDTKDAKVSFQTPGSETGISSRFFVSLAVRLLILIFEK